MKKLNYSFLFFFLFGFLINPCFALMKSNHGLDGYEYQKIDAVKNARMHSNMGNIYFSEKNYVSALKEYEIAYSLTSNTSASSVYLYNIARCYIQNGNYNFAKKVLLDAINKDCLNITYYEALVECFIALNIQDIELNKYLNDYSNPYNRIVVGLIYLKTNQKMIAKAVFDEFINEYPDMLITQDVKRLIKKL